MVAKQEAEIVGLYDELTSHFSYQYPQVTLVSLFEKALQFFSSIGDKVNEDFCMTELKGYGIGEFDDVKANIKKVPTYRYMKIRSDDEQSIKRLQKEATAKGGKLCMIVGEPIGTLEHNCYNYVFPPPMHWTNNGIEVYATEHDLIYMLGNIKSELRQRVYSNDVTKLISEKRASIKGKADPLSTKRNNDKSKLIKHIKKIRNDIYKSYEGGFRADVKHLLDFFNDNSYTNKIINDLRNKYPNVHWDPSEWVEPHVHVSGFGSIITGDQPKIELHEDIFEPTQQNERAAGDLKLIEQIATGKCSADWLFQFTSGRYDQRNKRVTERFIDPLVDYICDTIKGDDKFVMVRSGYTDQGRKALQEVFQTLVGDIRICDAYIDKSLAIYISNIAFDKANRIRVLTVQDKRNRLSDEDILCLRSLQKYYNIEIRGYVDTHHPIHDRYILSDSRSYKCGASLKDFGKKDTDIQTMDELVSDWSKAFDDNWKMANPII
jgi:hypothetical protein